MAASAARRRPKLDLRQGAQSARRVGSAERTAFVRNAIMGWAKVIAREFSPNPPTLFGLPP